MDDSQGGDMSLVELLILLVIAGVVGAIAEYFVGFTPGGLLMSIAIGIAGAYLGTWLARQIGLPSILAINVGSQTIELVWALLGSILLVALLRAIRAPRRTGRRRSWRRRSY
jgi:uncharacterized membrane protein YeaQ/YmgE (transglycosylase-associated protein family)